MMMGSNRLLVVDARSRQIVADSTGWRDGAAP